MTELSLKDYLLDCSQDELTERLIKLDASIMALHLRKNLYIVGFDANKIKLYDGELNFRSFNDKLDYLHQSDNPNIGSGLNANGDKKDILEMCAVGICAYNGFTSFYTNNEFIAYLISNFDMFCNNGKIPSMMIEYYQSVLVNGDIDYLNNFLYKKQNENANSSQIQSNGNRLTKSTAIGRAFDDKEAAYVNVLLLPALVTLIIITILVGYLIFIN